MYGSKGAPHVALRSSNEAKKNGAYVDPSIIDDLVAKVVKNSDATPTPQEATITSTQ